MTPAEAGRQDRVAWEFPTAAPSEELDLLKGFNPFRDDRKHESMGQRRNCGHDRVLLGPVTDTADKGSVDLEGPERKVRECCERRVAPAKLIDHEPYPGVAQAVQRRGY